MRLRNFALVACALLPLSASVFAAGTPDPVIKAMLEKAELKYEIDADGDFKVVFEVGDADRTQMAYVRSNVETYGAVSVREILTLGYRAPDGKFPPLVTKRLLENNNEVKLGAWAQQKDIGVFTVKVPADASQAELVDYLEFAVTSADSIEQELSGDKDEF